MHVIGWLLEHYVSILAGVATLLTGTFAWFAAKATASNKRFLTYLINGIVYIVVERVTQNASAYLSLRRYCRISLKDSRQYLNVPGARDVNLDIDKIYVPLVLTEGGA